MRPTPITRRSGFSMIELLIVFVVFGLVVMISIRSVGDTLRRDRAAKAAYILGADIEQAFAIAARQRMPVMMSSTSRTRPSRSSIGRARRRSTAGARSRRRPTIGVDTLYANRDTIIIMPNGIATNTMNITLRITSTGGAPYTKRVSVSTRRHGAGEQPMNARAGVPSRMARRAPRTRAGVSLIEVVVACTLLALTFTSLTALTARMAAAEPVERLRRAAHGDLLRAGEPGGVDDVRLARDLPHHRFGQVRTGLLRVVVHGGSRVGEHERARHATGRSR